MPKLRAEDAALPDSTRGRGELPLDDSLGPGSPECGARTNIGVASANGPTIMPMERLTLVSGGTSGGIDSGMPTPVAFGEPPVTNARSILVDRAYRK